MSTQPSKVRDAPLTFIERAVVRACIRALMQEHAAEAASVRFPATVSTTSICDDDQEDQ